MNIGFFQCCVYNGGFWVRIFGRGLSVINKRKHPPLFSERTGRRKVWRVGRYGVEWLPKSKPGRRDCDQ